MKQFAIAAPTDVRVVGVNLRREKHGKQRVPAMDVRCTLTAANTVLDQFKPELRDALYTPAKEGSEPAQPELDGVDPVTDTPLLRVPGLAPVHLNDDMSGYTATFDLGTGRKESVVELAGAKVNAFAIEALQGGSVRISFRIQASHVGKREIGEIGVLIDSDVGLKLEPPATTDPIDGTMGDGATGNTAADVAADTDIRRGGGRRASLAKKVAAAAKRAKR